MKFSIGDKVRFLDEKGGGIIVKINKKGWVVVETEDGFEIPYRSDMLVPVEPIKKENAEDSIQNSEEKEKESEENIMLKKEDILKLLLEKEKKKTRAKTSVPHLKNQSLEKEVDLHIEELLDNWKGMSNAQLIEIQLNHMQRELDNAIALHMRSIIFIHGVGNGRLKAEVRKILETYSGIRFHDASYSKYGFGATEVELW